MLPQGLLSRINNQLVGLALQAGTNVVITKTNQNYNFQSSVASGIILQTVYFALANPFTPVNAYSTTYSSANQFASIPITTLSNNSSIIIVPSLTFLIENGCSSAFWINGSGAPLGAFASQLTASAECYVPGNQFFTHQNTTINTFNINCCGFYSPATSSSSVNRILGASDGFSYGGSLASSVTVYEVQN